MEMPAQVNKCKIRYNIEVHANYLSLHKRLLIVLNQNININECQSYAIVLTDHWDDFHHCVLTSGKNLKSKVVIKR